MVAMVNIYTLLRPKRPKTYTLWGPHIPIKLILGSTPPPPLLEGTGKGYTVHVTVQYFSAFRNPYPANVE